MLEIILGCIFGYYNLSFGLSIFLMLKAFLAKSIKISMLLLTNLLTNIFLGPSYIVYSKIYILLICGIFFYDQFFQFKINNTKPIEKIKEFYNFINYIISIPFYIIYENINYYFKIEELKNHKYFSKIYEQYDMMNNMISPNALNMSDNMEMENMMETMFNMDMFMDMANGMRENIGKKPLTKKDANVKMIDNDQFNNMFSSISDFNKLFKEMEHNENKPKNKQYKNK
jgi:hypothetical protein